MPKPEMPSDVELATRAFCTPLRVMLIRHYMAHPGAQALAVEALEESSANISRNTQVLIEAGVVQLHQDPTRGRSYSVDQGRVWDLLGVLGRYTLSGL